ncbi:relaxation protein [Dyella sp.]|uniref:relaxation protein n=1 Tax=Dyella sp. TaxID=1869338 RepID=UPI002ED022A9
MSEQGESRDDAEALIFKAGVLLEQFARYCEQQGQHQTVLAERLQYAVTHAPDQLRQSAERVFASVPQSVSAQVDAGLGASMRNYEGRIAQAATQLQERSAALTRQLSQMEAFGRRLIWKVSAAVIAALLVAVIGGAVTLSYYREQVHANQLSAELLRAYNQADVTICGAQLCANVEKNGQKYGDKGQYLPIRAR